MINSHAVVSDHQTPLRQLRDRVDQQPESPLVRFREDGAVRDVGAADLLHEADLFAAGLRALGAKPGDRIALLLDNRIDFVVFWFAIPLAGLIEVPVNAEQRGPTLRHVLDDSSPVLVIAEPGLLTSVVESGYDGDAGLISWDDQARESLRSHGVLEGASDPAASELSTVMFTSGTTGPSKGVMLSHGYMSNLGRNFHSMRPDLGPEDVYYLCTPMFHIDARCLISAALWSGGCFAFAERFSSTGFWDDVVDFSATFFLFIGAMLSILTKTRTPEGPPVNQLRAGTGAPIPVEAYEYFEDELGIQLNEVYGMTEAAAVTWSTPDRRRRGSAGHIGAPYEVVILGDGDEVLPPNRVGEIAFRGTGPDEVTLGYWRRPEVTVETFRNLWFHSGDLGQFDEDGFLWFVGRKKDSIRRRGENISAFEVESTMNQMDGVLEVAALPIADELGGEDEILLLVVRAPGSTIDAYAVACHANDNLARFAKPRWVDFVDELPHTPTGKLAKPQLKHEPSETAVLVADLYSERR